MSDQKDTPQNQPKTLNDFDKMPEPQDFAALDSKLQNGLLEKFADVEDTDEEEPKKSEGEEVEEEPAEDPKDEEVVEEEPEEETPEEDPKEADSKPVDWEKRYKDLQREFTSRNETLKTMQERFEELEKKVTSPEQTPSERKRKLDELAEKNPKAKDFFDALKDGIGELIEEKIQPLHNTLEQSKAEENETKFISSVDEFLKSDLAELEPELDQIVAREYGSQKKLLEAARRNPSLFQSLKKELLSEHLDKVIEVKARKKDAEEEDPKKRNRMVKKTGVSGKSRTATPKDSDDLDLKSFKALSTYEEKKRVLDKQGLVDESAKPRRRS